MKSWISRIAMIPFAAAAWAPAALAHPGHVADQGHGHAHWLALAILGGLGLVALLYGLYRASARRGTAKLERVRNRSDG